MKYFYLVVVVLLVDVSFSCPLDCSQVTCLQGFNPFDCPENTLHVKNAAMCGCCPGCIQLKGPAETCQEKPEVDYTFDIKNYYTTKTYLSTGDATPIISSLKCAPGLKCIDNICVDVNKKYSCIADATFDVSQPYKWLPDCDIDGSYKAMQCKGTSADSRCFCYSKMGTRIFGFDWKANSDKMKCLCSRLVDDLKKDPNSIDVTYHCSSNGNFEPLQCNRGICYCANVFTGQPTSYAVAEPWWTTLPCYNQTTMGTIYLKMCDSQYNAVALLRKEMQYHGGKPLNFVAPSCDPDGSYAAKQCDGNNECHCENRAYQQIGSYATVRNTEDERRQKCYCARDEVLFNDQKIQFNYQCDNGGNYYPLQTMGDTSFCVDEDGFIISQTENEANGGNKCNLPCAKC